MASYFLYLHILNIVFFRIHSFTNLYTLQSFSYQLLICRVAKNLPVLELLNHFIKSSTVAYKRVAYKKIQFTLFRAGFFIRSLPYGMESQSQYSVRLLCQCWITGGHTLQPPIEGLLPPTGIKPTPFRNSAFEVAGQQVHATTPD